MKLLLITTLFLLNTGCALFSGGDSSTKEDGFTKTAAATGQPMPLPVEIAEDIAMISEAGLVTMEDQSSKPSGNVKSQQDTAQKETEQKKQVVEALPTKGKQQIKNKKAVRVTSKTLGRKVFRKPSSQGKAVTYTVKPSDTLMKISFAHYGNVYRWREIYKTNQAKIQDFNQLIAGTVLTIDGVTYVKIDRNGKPYLIRWGDTLGKISQKVYGTKEFWEALWQNNRQLIRNPNRIYADFTLYYQPINEVRNPASEPTQR